jgi:hypothetical protein
MNETENNQDFQMDDESVLTYLLQNVRGLRPVSTGDDLALDEDISYS